MAAMTDMRAAPQAAGVVARFRAQGYEPAGVTLYAYAAVQVWAQAVAAAGSLDLDAVTRILHSRQFDTMLGRIGFDAKGDVTGLSRGNGSSGRRTVLTCRWSKNPPRNSAPMPSCWRGPSQRHSGDLGDGADLISCGGVFPIP